MINCLIMFSCGQFMYLVLTIWLMYFGKLVKSDERCKDGEDWNINYFQESKGKKSQHFSTWRSLYVVKIIQCVCYSNFKNRFSYKCSENRLNLPKRL